MLGNKEFFQGSGKVNRDALAGFIKDIKKNTKLSDEDAAVIAASKVKDKKNRSTIGEQVNISVLQIVDSQPKSRMWYRIGATRNLTGGRKIMPSLRMNDQVRQVS